MRFLLGLTLVELLLSMTLSILLIIGISSAYLFSQKIHAMQMQSINTLETMRVVSELLRNEIKLAGYIGCAKLSKLSQLENHTPYTLTSDNIISIFQNGSGLIVRHASLQHASLIQDMDSSSILYITNDVILKENEIIIISDCDSAAIVQVKTVHKIDAHLQRITICTPLTHLYKKTAWIAPLEINSYYLTKATLYKKDIHHKQLAIADTISALKIKLSVKTNRTLEEKIPEEINYGEEIVGVQLSYQMPSNKTGFIYTALGER